MRLRSILSAALLAAHTAAGIVADMPSEALFAKPQLSTRFEMSLRGGGQRVAEELLDEAATNSFPLGAFLLECRWETYPGSMRFDATEFPDPAGLISRIRARGIVPIVSVSCFVSPDSREYRRYRFDPDGGGLDNLLHGPSGRDAAILRWRDGCSAAWDLTKPVAFGYLLDALTSFLERSHAEGFVFDALDVEMLAGCGFHDPSLGAEGYLSRYAQFARHFPCSVYSAGNVKGGARAVARLPERRQTWADLRGVVPEVLALGRQGVLFVVPDGVGGGDPAGLSPNRRYRVDEALFVRSCALQAMMPMMQFAMAPWRVLSPAGMEACRGFVRLHMKMAPYILEQVRNAAQTGRPVVQSMNDAFPGQGFDRPLQQFMLGPKYLVAPVVSADGSVTVEFPAGVWRDPRGMTVEGPKSIRLDKVPLTFLPYFERQ